MFSIMSIDFDRIQVAEKIRKETTQCGKYVKKVENGVMQIIYIIICNYVSTKSMVF